MPKMSKESAQEVAELPDISQSWQEDLEGGYQAAFVRVEQSPDLAPLLRGLPGDQCPCPHWGYVFEGSISFDIAGTTEVIDAGEAFYIPPGHTPKATPGTEFLIFSPTELAHEVDAAMERNAKLLQKT